MPARPQVAQGRTVTQVTVTRRSAGSPRRSRSATPHVSNAAAATRRSSSPTRGRPTSGVAVDGTRRRRALENRGRLQSGFGARPADRKLPADPGTIRALQQVAIVAAAAAAAALPQQLPQSAAAEHQDQPSQAYLGPFGAPLRQYGYAMFASNVSTFAPVDDIPVGPDYVVGPGDDLDDQRLGSGREHPDPHGRSQRPDRASESRRPPDLGAHVLPGRPSDPRRALAGSSAASRPA